MKQSKTKIRIKRHTRKTKQNKKQIKKRVKKLIVKKWMTDDEIKNQEGRWFPETYFQHKITSDTDVYYLDNDGKKQLLCSFRKKVIPDEFSQVAFDALHKYAGRWHTNRGAAAGMLNSKKLPQHVGRLTKRDRFRAYYYTKDGKFQKDHISNSAQSNIIGYYDVPDRNIKNGPACRETKFNRDYPAQWQSIQPLLKHIGDLFKQLVPDNYEKQYKIASETPLFQIQGTPFSTVTINKNWQTALHRDKGDFMEGFGNLIVLERGKMDGCYLGFPQFKVCVDVKQGDFLAMDVHQWHCNTDLYLQTDDASRISMVCYLRKNMIRCKN